MSQTRYVALLRGINVGGNNLIKMADLKACFEDQGFDDVATYIASGNVVFGTSVKDPVKLEASIEKVLSKRFGYVSRIVLRSAKQLQRDVAKCPRGFGSQPEKFRYDVIFLKAPLTVQQTLESFKPKQGVDTLWPGDGLVYSSRLIARASQSRLVRVLATSIYQDMTIRNWNTTRKLAAMA